MSSSDFVYRGDLTTTALPEVLSTVHRYGVPGVMEFARDEERKRVYFFDGDVIFATSTDRTESLGDFLLREGKITLPIIHLLPKLAPAAHPPPVTPSSSRLMVHAFQKYRFKSIPAYNPATCSP